MNPKTKPAPRIFKVRLTGCRGFFQEAWWLADDNLGAQILARNAARRLTTEILTSAVIAELSINNL